MDSNGNINGMGSTGQTLVVRLSADGFRLAQSDEAGRVNARLWGVDPAVSVLANLKAMLATVQRPPRGFGRVCAVACDHRVTVLPAGLHDSDLSREVCEACFDLDDCDALESCEVPNAGCVALFAFNRFVKRYLVAEFGKAECFNAPALLLDVASARAKERAGRVMTVAVSGGLMPVFAHDAGRLLFSNVFECSDDNLRLFYMLHTWKALGFSQLDDRLDIVDNGGCAKGLVQLARLYIGHVVPCGCDLRGMAVSGDAGAMTDDMACLLRVTHYFDNQ